MLYDQPLVDTTTGRHSAEPGPRLYCKVQTNFAHLMRLAVYRRPETFPVTTLRSVRIGTDVRDVLVELSPDEVLDLLEMVAGAANVVIEGTIAEMPENAFLSPRAQELLNRRAAIARSL